MFEQNYNPLGNVVLSTIAAAIPILTLLYFIALHPHREVGGGERGGWGPVGAVRRAPQRGRAHDLASDFRAA